MPKNVPPFEVTCPCCSAVLKVDAEIKGVIAHTAAVKPKMFADIEEAARAMKEQDTRRDSIFRQSVEAQAAGGNPGYVSRANPYPIYAWSRALFWLVSICIAGVIWIGASIVERSRRVG